MNNSVQRGTGSVGQVDQRLTTPLPDTSNMLFDKAVPAHMMGYYRQCMPEVFVFPAYPAKRSSPESGDDRYSAYKRFKSESPHTPLTPSPRFIIRSPLPMVALPPRLPRNDMPLDLSKDSKVSPLATPSEHIVHHKPMHEVPSPVQIQPLDLTTKPKETTPTHRLESNWSDKVDSKSKDPHRTQKTVRTIQRGEAVIIPTDPRRWTREDVKKWLLHLQRINNIKHLDTDRFPMNGKALCLMSENMFMQRVPHGGHFLYRDFRLRVLKVLMLEKELQARRQERIKARVQVIKNTVAKQQFIATQHIITKQHIVAKQREFDNEAGDGQLSPLRGDDRPSVSPTLPCDIKCRTLITPARPASTSSPLETEQSHAQQRAASPGKTSEMSFTKKHHLKQALDSYLSKIKAT